MRGYRMGTAPGSGRQRGEHHQWKPLAAVLAIALLISAVPLSVWARPADLPRAQDDSAAGDTPLPGQVIAQGIARLQRGEVA